MKATDHGLDGLKNLKDLVLYCKSWVSAWMNYQFNIKGFVYTWFFLIRIVVSLLGDKDHECGPRTALIFYCKFDNSADISDVVLLLLLVCVFGLTRISHESNWLHQIMAVGIVFYI